MTQSIPSPFLLPLFNSPGVSPPENFEIKDACRRVLEHFRHKRQLNFVPPFPDLCIPPMISVTHFVSPGVPLDAPE